MPNCDQEVIRDMVSVPGGQDQTLSVLVVLRPPEDAPAIEEITADHVHQFLPSPDVVRAVTRWFASRGFDVGETVGISFPLTGPRSLFQDTFHPPAGEPPQEALSLDALPPDIARHIDTATFTPPPEFGPGNP